MLVDVFRSSRKSDTYLYLQRGAGFDDLPKALLDVFGDPQPALSLNLAPERQLARYSGAEVIDAIEEQGFFLQLPEATDEKNKPTC